MEATPIHTQHTGVVLSGGHVSVAVVIVVVVFHVRCV